MILKTTLKVKKYTSSEIIDKLLVVIESLFSENTSNLNIILVKVSTIIDDQEINLSNPQIKDIKLNFNKLKNTLIESNYICIKDITIFFKFNNSQSNSNYEFNYSVINENNIWDQILFNPNSQQSFSELHKKLI